MDFTFQISQDHDILPILAVIVYHNDVYIKLVCRFQSADEPARHQI